MSTVVNKATLERRDSVNTPDYDTSLWLINPDHLDAPKHHVRVNDAGDNLELLPSSEIEEANQAVFGALKAGMIEFFRDQFRNERERRYEIDTLLYAQHLMYKAAVEMNEETIDYLTPLVDWVVDGDKLVREAEKQVLESTNEEELNAVSIDFSEWLGADPGVSVRFAEDM